MKKQQITNQKLVVKTIIDFFQTIPYPRLDRQKKHPLLSILVCAFCAVIADCDTWVDIELFCREREDWFKKLHRSSQRNSFINKKWSSFKYKFRDTRKSE